MANREFGKQSVRTGSFRGRAFERRRDLSNAIGFNRLHLLRICASAQHAGIMMHQTFGAHSISVAVMSTHDSLFTILCGVNMRE